MEQPLAGERRKTISTLTHILFGSCPNGSMLGGWMSEKYLDVYSRYLEKFLQGYAQAGAPVHAITSQNEIGTTSEWQNAGLSLVARVGGSVRPRSFRPAAASAAPDDSDFGCSIITTVTSIGWHCSSRISG